MTNFGVRDVENVPHVGMIFNSETEAYDFYNAYGGRIGFSIRRAYVHRSKFEKSKITSSRYVCSKEGVKMQDKRVAEPKNPRANTRTNCHARMGIMIMTNGQYECHDFIQDHNHPLHTPATSHMMRSQRTISDAHAAEIDLADDSGLRPKAIFDFMGNQAGGREYLGHTRQDQKNYLRTKRQRNLARGEAGSLLGYFQKQAKANPSFSYSVQLDIEEQITNIFWADPRMIIDYALFGDVITFDTTFGTNKDYRPFGIFAGFNHHRGVVIFGATLLYDETASSFKWLFETFLETHGLKKPKTIFTDQDVAMAKAIKEVIPETWHGLCTWHIMQNGIKHLGHLMREGSRLLSDFKACMFQYNDEVDFEKAWEKMRIDYALPNGTWLDHIYGLREKWAKCYMKNTFTLGIRSTQLSESLNGSLKRYVKSSLDVPQFFTHFERMINDKRYNELKAEYEARNKITKPKHYSHPILRQAAEVYTPYIFDAFQKEFDWVGDCYIKLKNSESIVCREFVIAIKDDEFNVQCTPSDDMITCSCRKFETYGILCYHTLKVLDVLDIKYIPPLYILSRWTRAARDIMVEDPQGNLVEGDVQLSYTQRYNVLCPLLVKIASQASTSADGYNTIYNDALQMCNKLKYLQCSDQNLGEPKPGVASEDTTLHLAKGLKKKEKCKGGKRTKSWVEKQGNRKKKGNTPISHSQGPPQTQPSSASYPIQWNPSYRWQEMGSNITYFTTSQTGHVGYSQLPMSSSQGSLSMQGLVGYSQLPMSSSQSSSSMHGPIGYSQIPISSSQGSSSMQGPVGYSQIPISSSQGSSTVLHHMQCIE